MIDFLCRMVILCLLYLPVVLIMENGGVPFVVVLALSFVYGMGAMAVSYSIYPRGD